VKKKYSLFLTAFLLVACIATSCSPNQASPSSKSESSETNQGSTAVNLGKYNPPIDATWIYASDPTIDTNVLPYVDDTVKDNRWLKKYEDDMGIKVKYDWIARDAAEYDQKLNLSMASGDLPDFFSVNATELKSLVKTDMVADLTDIFKKYADENTNKILCTDEYTKPGWTSCTYDKKLMAIPRFTPVHDEASYLWIRTDWLKKLGMSAPKSMSDVNNIIKAFTTKDPDGNNQNDT
jgi:putative aldouronate transport system substrate-binding protein